MLPYHDYMQSCPRPILFPEVETVKQEHSRDPTITTAAVFHITAEASANAIRQEKEIRRLNIEK